MRIVTSVILAGLFLLFLGNVFLSDRTLSPYKRSCESPLSQTASMLPEKGEALRKKISFSRMKQVFVSFDLMGGLTEKDFDNMTLTSHRFATFFFLLVCLWLVLGLKSSGLGKPVPPSRLR